MKISVSSYSYQQYMRDGKMTQFDCVEKAKEMGFDAIEFTGLNGNTFEEKKELAKRIREKADEIGIEVNAYTVGASLYKETKEETDVMIEALKSQLDIAKILGAKVMRHDVCSSLGKKGNARSFDLMLPTLAKNARTITEYAEKLGIKTCSENHGFIAQDSDRMERLFNAVNHENYGLLIDIGNFLCVDENPVTATSRLAPYAIHVHAKDILVHDHPFYGYHLMSRGGNYLMCSTIGEGSVPVEQCIRILKRAEYEGFITIEYEGREDCEKGIKKGLDKIRCFINNSEE